MTDRVYRFDRQMDRFMLTKSPEQSRGVSPRSGQADGQLLMFPFTWWPHVPLPGS